MGHGLKHLEFPVALLVMGSAISLLSCGGRVAVTDAAGDEALISRTVRDMEVLSSENGEKTRLMRAPLMEEHAFAKAAFEEFPQGMEVVGFDSIGRPSSKVTADYALHWTARDLWELKGNVFVEGEEGQRLYTQQLTWDRKIAKIYSNVDSKVEEGEDVFIGEGFEANDDFSRWTFRRLKGTVGVNMETSAPPADSVAVSSGDDSMAGAPAGVEDGGASGTEPATATAETEPATATEAATENSEPNTLTPEQ